MKKYLWGVALFFMLAISFQMNALAETSTTLTTDSEQQINNDDTVADVVPQRLRGQKFNSSDDAAAYLQSDDSSTTIRVVGFIGVMIFVFFQAHSVAEMLSSPGESRQIKNSNKRTLLGCFMAGNGVAIFYLYFIDLLHVMVTYTDNHLGAIFVVFLTSIIALGMQIYTAWNFEPVFYDFNDTMYSSGNDSPYTRPQTLQSLDELNRQTANSVNHNQSSSVTRSSGSSTPSPIGSDIDESGQEAVSNIRKISLD
ncbi:hypothetical protein F0267_00750 [Vibrio coralliilyticus]|uniref:Uncharacterized protein n=1 Tax=Vibrio coralliilyticus TaxID=190893 RepID=A0AAN0W097_9VIBR|nr:hypothetical protein [Vibrio coralliilyticus]AIW22653.1 hypothetical protein IX92_26710 [Vibrio coralliilyticus]NOH36749.1 hypothetical protein [Vibrio coralliilyticus]